jgi:hypothetical protein
MSDALGTGEAAGTCIQRLLDISIKVLRRDCNC